MKRRVNVFSLPVRVRNRLGVTELVGYRFSIRVGARCLGVESRRIFKTEDGAIAAGKRMIKAIAEAQQ